MLKVSGWGLTFPKSGMSSEYIPMMRDGRSPSPHPHPTAAVRSYIMRFLAPALIFLLGIIIGINYPLFLSVYSRRAPQLPSYLPVSLPPAPSSLIPPVPSLPGPLEPIPNIVHYVYGLLPAEKQPDFPYFAYLAMRSAMMVLKPEKVMFHCIEEPKGYWWDRVLDWEGWEDEEGEKKGLVQVLRARDVQYIGKERKPVKHYAHKADIIRLEVLQQYGGVYLDIDTYVLRPFAPLSLYSYDTVMGMEGKTLDFLRKPGADDEMDPKGLCNAIIISRPGSLFLERWLESYEAFDDRRWTQHSVEMPWKLARLYPTTITVLSERAFFWPLWSDDHIHAVYASTEYDFEASGQLAYHAWESVAKKYLKALDPSTITSIDTSFTRMVRKFREPSEEKRWRAEGKLDGVGSGTGLSQGEEESEAEEVGRNGYRLRRRPQRGAWD